MITIGQLMTAILLVFYLYLLAHFDLVKRKGCYLVGVAGLLLIMVGMFFLPWLGSDWANVLVGIFNWVGSLVAFLAAVGACYGAELCMADKLSKGICHESESEEE